MRNYTGFEAKCLGCHQSHKNAEFPVFVCKTHIILGYDETMQAFNTIKSVSK